MDSNNRIIANVGPFQVDVPQSLGYFSGIAAAVAFGFLEPPVAVFIAAVPMLKMLANPAPQRFVEEMLQGAAKPVGSDGEGTAKAPSSSPTPTAPGRTSNDSPSRRLQRSPAASAPTLLGQHQTD